MAIKIPLKQKEEVAVASMTVAELLPGFGIPDGISSALYTGSPDQLLSITRWLGMKFGKEVLVELKQPTSSALVKERKKMAADWWEYLTERVDVPESLKPVIMYQFRDAFEHATHKIMTGHELPKTKDGFQHNALKGLRQATGHGDAALLLYRIRYWWPKASVIQNGKKWIAKTHKQWADELGIAPRTFRTAYERLLERGLVEAITTKFKGNSMLHLRPTPEAVALFQYKDAGAA